MENVIIIVVIVAAAVIGIYYTVKHFKGQGGCCGGGGYKSKRKKLANVKYRRLFTVEGMMCEHCKNRIEESVNDVCGVAGRADVKKGILTVSYAEDVSDEVVKSRIERLGYTVTKIERG